MSVARHSAGRRIMSCWHWQRTCPPPARPSRLERSNRETIARMGAIDVACLDAVAQPRREELARAGATLPWPQWLGAARPRVWTAAVAQARAGAQLACAGR